jgi:hypothetical protein
MHGARAAAGAPFIAVLEEEIGSQGAERTARMLAPFLHGFVAMELAGAMRGGQALVSAFDQGVDAILEDLRRAMRTEKKPSGGKSARLRKGGKS